MYPTFTTPYNTFEFLQVGDKKYELEETKIHVFRETPENKGSDDDDIFFNNHRDQHSSTFKFIGE